MARAEAAREATLAEQELRVAVAVDVGHGHLTAESIDVQSDAQAFYVARWIQAVAATRAEAEAVVDRTVRVFAADSAAEAAPFVFDAFDAGVRVLDGVDADGNGVIDLFAGELGVRGLARQAPTLISGALVAQD